MSEQAIQFLRTLSSLVYGISLTDALSALDAALLLNPVKFDWSTATLAQRADEARKQATVMAHLPDRKIQAIKEIRTISGLGLKEAKDIIDTIQPVSSTWRHCCSTRTTDTYHDSLCYNYNPPF